MKKIIFIFFGIAAGLYWYQQKTNFHALDLGESRQVSETSPTKNSCTGKQYCAVIYVAPWCPACKQGAPFFKKMLANSWSHRAHGLEIVVGKGDPQQNLDEALSFGAGASADQDETRFRSLGIRQYPSFFVLDSTGKPVMRDQTALNWMIGSFSRN